MRPRRSLWAALGLAVLLLTGPAAGSALAHEALVGTTPATGAWVSARPPQVRLSFVVAPEALGAAAVVSGPGGVQVAAGSARIDGHDLVVDLQPAGDPSSSRGAYTVTWRVTSSDGHPLSGRFSFGVGEPGSAQLPGVEGAAPFAAQRSKDTRDGARVLFLAAGGAAVAGLAGLLALRFVLLRRSRRSTP